MEINLENTDNMRVTECTLGLFIKKSNQ